MAEVHVVIIGFSYIDMPPMLYYHSNGLDGDVVKKPAKHINAYLVDFPDVFVGDRMQPICDVPSIGIGNKPIDGGNYLFNPAEMEEFIRKEPKSKKYFKRWIGADELTNGTVRYMLWLGDCTPAELRSMPECMKRVNAVREFRLKSTTKSR